MRRSSATIVEHILAHVNARFVGLEVRWRDVGQLEIGRTERIEFPREAFIARRELHRFTPRDIDEFLAGLEHDITVGLFRL